MTYLWWTILILLSIKLCIVSALPFAIGQARLHATQKLIQAAIVICMTLIYTQLYHPAVALIATMVTYIVVMVASRSKHARHISSTVWHRYNRPIAKFVAGHSFFDRIADNRSVSDKVGVSSFDELNSIVKGATFIGQSDRAPLITHISSIGDSVADIVKPLADTLTISQSDIIGPLLLDDLHNSGQKAFLVVDQGGRTKGTIKLTQLTESSTSVSTVRDVMDQHLIRIQKDTSLTDAFAKMCDEQVWVAIVSDGGNDIGTISMADVQRAILGKHPL